MNKNTIKPFTDEEVIFLTQNYKRFSIEALLHHINANRHCDDKMERSTFRSRMYAMELKKTGMVRWKPEWVDYLIENYRTMGDVELTENLNKLFELKLTKKHIGKKRQLMLIKRTDAEIAAIRAENVKQGKHSTADKMWATIGVGKDGDTRIWRLAGKYVPVIKIDGTWVHKARYVYEQENGPVPDGYKVYHKDGNRMNCEPENLVARNTTLTAAERLKYKWHDRQYVVNMELKKAPIAAAPVMPNLNMTHENKVRVVINSKLTVWAKPGTDITKLREKYAAL